MSDTKPMVVEAKWDWVVIEEDEAIERGRTEAGIIMPNQMSEDVRRGKVVAVGIGKAMENGHVRPFQTEVGAYVLCQDVGHVFMVGAKQYRAIKEEDIICEVKNH